MDEERRKQQEKLKITINQEKVEQAKEQLKSPTNEDIEATKENQVSNSRSVWRRRRNSTRSGPASCMRV